MFENIPNILIVDDDDYNLLYLGAILKPLPVNVIQATSGITALEKIKDKEIAVALLDVHMPEMNGIELATRLKDDKGRDIIPVIFITAYTYDEKLIQELYDAGGVDFISKPFLKNILLSKLKIFLELNRQKHLILESRNDLEKLANELKHANNFLSLSEQKYRNFIEQSLQGQIVIQDNTIVFANEAFTRLTSYNIEELSLLTPEQVNELLGINGSTITNQSNRNINIEVSGLYEIKSNRKDGSELWLQVFSSVIDYNEAPAILVAINDITSEKEIKEELKNIFELSVDIVCIVDTINLNLIKVNPAFTATTGFVESDLIGRSVLEFIHPDDQQSTVDVYVNNNIQGTDTINFENRFLCKNGQYKWLNWVSHPVLEKGLSYAVAHDITKRKEVEGKIFESEKLYRSLVNASPEAIIILDIKGEIIEVSDITVDLFEAKSKNDFSGIQFSDFFGKGGIHQLNEVLNIVLNEGLIQNQEFILRSLKNTQLVTEISATLIQESNGNPKAYMVIIRDISNRRKLEQQLIHSERMAGIGEIATSIAHEINQPLNNISLSLENILYAIKNKESIDDNYFELKSNNIFDNINRIGNIIDHLRAFSRTDTDFKLTTFDINISIKNALMLINEQFKNHEINLTVNLDDNLENIIGNTYKFEQVIVNLLINAQDALEEKSNILNNEFKKTLSIKSSSTKTDIIVEVKDNGIGINYDIQDKIKLPFFTTKEIGKGTGLGLSVSTGIINELKGSIEIQSEPDVGTKVIITLPINK